MSRGWIAAIASFVLVVASSAAALGYVIVRYATYVIPSDDMAPTLRRGQLVVADRFAYRDAGPKRGDIVVFTSPLAPNIFFTERIVATPYDRFVIRAGRKAVNRTPVRDAYLFHPPRYDFAVGDYGITVDGKALDPEVAVIPHRGQWVTPDMVPPGCYVVLTDNGRLGTVDSRVFGFLCPGRSSTVKGSAVPEIAGRVIAPQP
jgi:signal peptidase I